MDIYEQILKCKTDEDLKLFAEEAINYFTDQALDDNKETNLIGSGVELNPVDYHLDDKNFEREDFIYCVNIWNGFIPKGMKIVYGRFLDRETGLTSNKGAYYYVDDESYVYEFFKFLRTREDDIGDEFDLISAAYEFTVQYFSCGPFDAVDREVMFKTLYKDNHRFHQPTKEHLFSSFKHKGGALCTERALMAENLLSVLGLEMIYVMDLSHTYNFFAQHREDGKADIYVVDFAKFVDVFDESFNYMGSAPFVRVIEDCTNEMLSRVVNNGERIEFQEFYYYVINGQVIEQPLDTTRTYGTDWGFEEKKLIL